MLVAGAPGVGGSSGGTPRLARGIPPPRLTAVRVAARGRGARGALARAHPARADRHGRPARCAASGSATSRRSSAARCAASRACSRCSRRRAPTAGGATTSCAVRRAGSCTGIRASAAERARRALRGALRPLPHGPLRRSAGGGAGATSCAAFGTLFDDGAGRRLLDFGCGTGTFLELAHRRGFDAYGVDLSPESVAHAREPTGWRARPRRRAARRAGDRRGRLRRHHPVVRARPPAAAARRPADVARAARAAAARC